MSDLSYKGKKRCCEVNCPVIVYWLVHSDQFLEGQAIRTFTPKAKRRINVLQHVIHLGVVNTAPKKGIMKFLYNSYVTVSDLLSARIVLCPDPDELVKVVGAKDGGVPREVVKVVHDDSHEEIEHEEAAQEDKGDEEEVGDVAAAHLARLQELARGLVPLDRPRVTNLSRPARQHDVGPRLPGRAPKTQTRVTYSHVFCGLVL